MPRVLARFREQPAFSSRLAFAAVLALTTSYLLRTLFEFGFRWVDDDGALMWFAATEFASLRFHEPCFYGQSYHLLFESFVAAPLVLAGVPHAIALPLAALSLGLAPWLILTGIAWRRGAVLLALVLAGAPLLHSDSYLLLLSLPRGFNTGLFFVALGAWLVLDRQLGFVRPAIAGFLVIFGVFAAPNAALLAFPLALYLLAQQPLERRTAGVVGSFAGGAALAAGVWMAMRAFYSANPHYDLFPPPTLEWSMQHLQNALKRPDAYFGSLVPLFEGRTELLVLAFVAFAAGSIRQRRFAGALSIGLALLLTIASLVFKKVHEGFESVFYPYARMFLAVPLLTAFAALVAFSPAPERRGVWPSTPVLVLLCFIFAAFATSKHLRARESIRRVSSQPQTLVLISRTEELERECTALRQLAVMHHTSLVVFAHNRRLAYGCAAKWSPSVETLLPDFERRTWRLVDESARARTSFLIADTDPLFCSRALRLGYGCTKVGDARLRTVLLATHGEPATVTILRLGMKQRVFDRRPR
jgi:hypothetical protein